VKKLRVTVNGMSYDVDVEVLEDDEDGGAPYGFPSPTSVSSPSRAAAAPVSSPSPRDVSHSLPTASTPAGSNVVTSPIAGVIAEIKTSVGAKVKENDLLLIIEAMKMHTNISSPVAGTIKEMKVNVGDAVQQGQVMVTFE
jgi:glutaconyl-CoA/methylmalonyl-CoA decarboxylase subunit gamma